MVGASTDSAEKNAAWARELGIHFPLLSDPDGEAVRALGIANDKGRARRTTFVIDARGEVAQVFEDVEVEGHADRVLGAVRAAS